MSDISTLRPGLMVVLKTSITGNVSYDKNDLGETPDQDGGVITHWETKRKVVDPEEHKESTKVRAEARRKIMSQCVQSGGFGLLCPEHREADLRAAMKDAQRIVDNFNDTARVSNVRINILIGRIAPNDAEAIRAITGELGDLMATMESGLANFDVDAVREAASRAKRMSQMVEPAAQAKVQATIDMAREAAKKIVAAGETAAKEIDKETIAAIARARTAFLDIDGETGEIAEPVATARAVDLEADEIVVAAPKTTVAQVELE